MSSQVPREGKERVPNGADDFSESLANIRLLGRLLHVEFVVVVVCLV